LDFSTTTIFNKKLRLLASLLLLACSVSLIYFFADNNATTVNTLPEPLQLAPEIMPHERKMIATATNQGSLILNNPDVTMDVERGVLQAKVHITVYLPKLASPISGFITVSGTPQLAEASKQFFLREATIEKVELPELPASARTRVDKALMTGVRTFFEQNAAYTPFNKPNPQNKAISVAL
jgi:hypothetical protein